MDDAAFKWQRLQKACARARLDLDDLLAACTRGDAQFHDRPRACGVTSIAVSGDNKVCYILVVAGELADVAPLASDIELFARQKGCTVIHTIGRPGFERVYGVLAEGFEPVGTLYEKVL